MESFGRLTSGRPIGRPGVGRPKDVLGVFSDYQLVILFSNIVPLIMEFTYYLMLILTIFRLMVQLASSLRTRKLTVTGAEFLKERKKKFRLRQKRLQQQMAAQARVNSDNVNNNSINKTRNVNKSMRKTRNVNKSVNKTRNVIKSISTTSTIDYRHGRARGQSQRRHGQSQHRQRQVRLEKRYHLFQISF
jgi:hypothetical protein